MKSSKQKLSDLPLLPNPSSHALDATLEEKGMTPFAPDLSVGCAADASENSSYSDMATTDNFLREISPYPFTETELERRVAHGLERDRKKRKAAEAGISPDLSESSFDEVFTPPKTVVPYTDSELDVLIERGLAEVRQERLETQASVTPIVGTDSSDFACFGSFPDSPTIDDFIRIWVPRYAFLVRSFFLLLCTGPFFQIKHGSVVWDVGCVGFEMMKLLTCLYFCKAYL